MHLKKGVVGQFAIVSVWVLKYGLKATSSRFNWSHWGTYAKTFLSDALSNRNLLALGIIKGKRHDFW